jgi:hypothetical protein
MSFDALIYCVSLGGMVGVVRCVAKDRVPYVRLPRMLGTTHEAVMGVLWGGMKVVWFEDGVNPVSGLPQRLYATMAAVGIEARQVDMDVQRLWDRLGGRSVARSTAEMLGKLRYLGGFASLGHDDLNCERLGGKTRSVVTGAGLHVEGGEAQAVRRPRRHKRRVGSLLALERLVDTMSIGYHSPLFF